MLSILILSQRGEGHELISKLKDEGHFPKIYQVEGPPPVDERYSVNRYQEHISTSDITIAASAGVGGLAESVPSGRTTVVGSRVCKLLVDNEDIKLALAKLLDLTVNEHIKGPEVIYGGWFHPKTGWLGQYAIQDYNRMLDGNRGPYTPGAGYVVGREDGIPFLESATEFLKSLNYHGWFGIRFVVTEDGLVLKKFDTDFVNNYLPAIVALEKKVTTILQALVHGSLLKPKDAFALSVTVVGELKDSHPQPEIAKYIWQRNGMLTITSSGSTVRESRRRVHRTLKNNVHDEAIYRSDIGITSIFEEEANHD